MPASARQIPLVLASASPRRRDFLTALGLAFRVVPADIDETPTPGEGPADYATRVARTKANAVAKLEPGAVVLAADTVVAIEGELLLKPSDRDHARRMLRQLSGREHDVFTAVAIAGPVEGAATEHTRVRFSPLSEAQIAWYLKSREPLDKAGAYAIQGLAGCFVEHIHGSPSNVVGLPLTTTLRLLREAGLDLPWTDAA